jgi:DNA recombination protein RmuC
MEIIILLIIIVPSFLLGWYAIATRNKNSANPVLEQQIALQQSLQQFQETLQQNLQQNLGMTLEQLRSQQTNATEQSGQLHQRMSETSRSLTELQTKLAAIEASSNHLLQMGKGIEDLQNILQAPKLRGTMGEIWLEELLAQMMPAEHFESQYKFKTGDIADIVLKLRDGALLAIDSKFSLENFTKSMKSDSETEKTAHEKAFAADIKRRVDEIAKKYILPHEGTLNFAFMYVPAENVYYQAFIEDKQAHNLIRYAFDHKVVPVSPNSLFAYLELVMLGLRGLAIEQRAASIQQGLTSVSIDLQKFHESYAKVGNNLRIASQHYESSDKRLGKVARRVQTLGSGSDVNPDQDLFELSETESITQD